MLDSSGSPLRIGIIECRTKRNTAWRAACESCTPSWFSVPGTKKGAEKRALGHAIEAHDWSPIGEASSTDAGSVVVVDFGNDSIGRNQASVQDQNPASPHPSTNTDNAARDDNGAAHHDHRTTTTDDTASGSTTSRSSQGGSSRAHVNSDPRCACFGSKLHYGPCPWAGTIRG